MVGFGVPEIEPVCDRWETRGFGRVIEAGGETEEEGRGKDGLEALAVLEDQFGFRYGLIPGLSRTSISQLWLTAEDWRHEADFYISVLFMRTLRTRYGRGQPHAMLLGHTRHPDQTGEGK